MSLIKSFFFNLPILLLTLSIAFHSCTSTKPNSVIYSDSYSENKDQTSIMIFPRKKIELPGKWTKTDYNTDSRQYFFQNAEGTTFAVALNAWDNYDFHETHMSPMKFVKAFYDWDSRLLTKKSNGSATILKQDDKKNYIVWRLVSDTDEQTYFLFGLKNDTAVNLSVTSNSWDEDKITALLESAYNF